MEVFVTQSYLTLCDPMDCNPAEFLSMGFSRQEYWSVLSFSFPGIFPTQRANPGLLYCRQILYHLSCRGSPEEGISALLRREQRACSMLTHLPPPPPPPPTCEGTVRRPGREPHHQKAKLASIMLLDFTGSTTVRKKFLLFSHPVCDILFWQPESTGTAL